MMIKLMRSSIWVFGLLIVSGMLYGCAENVSHKVEIVKADLVQLTVLVGQPTASGVSVIAKASSVLASTTYEKSAAVEVQKSIGNFLPGLGYLRLSSKKISSNQQFFCHITEPARFVLVERLPVEPLTVSVSVSITGWRQDMQTCPGKRSAL